MARDKEITAEQAQAEEVAAKLNQRFPDIAKGIIIVRENNYVGPLSSAWKAVKTEQGYVVQTRKTDNNQPGIDPSEFALNRLKNVYGDDLHVDQHFIGKGMGNNDEVLTIPLQSFSKILEKEKTLPLPTPEKKLEAKPKITPEKKESPLKTIVSFAKKIIEKITDPSYKSLDQEISGPDIPFQSPIEVINEAKSQGKDKENKTFEKIEQLKKTLNETMKLETFEEKTKAYKNLRQEIQKTYKETHSNSAKLKLDVVSNMLNATIDSSNKQHKNTPKISQATSKEVKTSEARTPEFHSSPGMKNS